MFFPVSSRTLSSYVQSNQWPFQEPKLEVKPVTSRDPGDGDFACFGNVSFWASQVTLFAEEVGRGGKRRRRSISMFAWKWGTPPWEFSWCFPFIARIPILILGQSHVPFQSHFCATQAWHNRIHVVLHFSLVGCSHVPLQEQTQPGGFRHWDSQSRLKENPSINGWFEGTPMT